MWCLFVWVRVFSRHFYWWCIMSFQYIIEGVITNICIMISKGNSLWFLLCKNYNLSHMAFKQSVIMAKVMQERYYLKFFCPLNGEIFIMITISKITAKSLKYFTGISSYKISTILPFLYQEVNFWWVGLHGLQDLNFLRVCSHVGHSKACKTFVLTNIHISEKRTYLKSVFMYVGHPI